jgi:glycosyltransferase involved in cell wall biosynthesis
MHDAAAAPAVPARIRVCHVITGLNTGGAEIMLERLLSATDRERFDPVVVSLLPAGVIAHGIRALGVPVHSLELAGAWQVPVAVVRLARLLRRLRADVVQGWMSHGNLVGGAAARLAGGLPVAWGIHQVDIGRGSNSRVTRGAIRLAGVLSGRMARQIVYCADAARRSHVAAGYDPARAVVITNGFDVDAFRPDPAARAAVRAELGIAADAPVAGLVARWSPLKDHATFVAAAGRVAAARPDARFVLAGRGVDGQNAELAALLHGAGITDRCHLLGDRRDVPRVLAALDVFALSSRTEAFPVAVGEAMACGVPCVVTDVGDAAVLVGETGRVVPRGDPAALGDALAQVLGMDADARARLGRLARQRVVERFSLRSVAARYQELHAALAAGAGRVAGPSGAVAEPMPRAGAGAA